MKIARLVVGNQTIFAYYAQWVSNGLVILYHHAEVYAQVDTLNSPRHFVTYVIQLALLAVEVMQTNAQGVIPQQL